MNKRMLWGATLPGCFVLALSLGMLTLPGSSLANPPDGAGNHNHGGGGGGGTIPVTVTFRDFPGDDVDPVPDRLMSDDLGDYIHKVDKVSTGIGNNGGNFFLKLTKGNQPAIRTLFFDFNDCASPGECFPPFADGFSIAGTNIFTSGSGINLREMFVGQVRDDLSLILALNLNSEDLGLWQLFFDPSDARCSGSTYITVRRIDTDTWGIEAGPDDVACLMEQSGGGEHIFSGLYHMPFKITVQTN